MKVKGHGTIKKSKAYGAIGTLILLGSLSFALGTTSISADEITSENGINVENVVSDNNKEELQSQDLTASDESIANESAEVNNEVTVDASPAVDEQAASPAVSSGNQGVATDTTTVQNESQNSSQEEPSTLVENHKDEETSLVATSQTQVEESKVSSQVATAPADSSVTRRSATGSAVDEVTSATLTNKGFDIQYNQPITAGAKIMFAVWSESNGQDDLIWYTADSHGHAVAKYTGSYGTYNIHTYQNLNGKMIGLNGRTIDVPKPSAKVSITKLDGTTYKVTVSDVPVYITSIQLPTWTEKDGQDDIIWYGTTQNSDSTFTRIVSIAEHNMESGLYNVHVYGTSAVTNSLTGLTGTHFESDYNFGNVHVEASFGQNGINISMPSDVSSGMTVYHAVWSAENDQDDLIWYKVPANGQLTAKYTGSYGTYLIHTYGVIKGNMVCLSATSINIPKPEVKATITKESTTTYKVTITDVPVYMDGIQVPTWTEKGGQDDIKWYKATKAADGSYYVIISEAEHNMEAGTYNVHIYGNNHVKNGFTGLLGTRFESDYKFGDVQVRTCLGKTGINISMPSDVSSDMTVYHAVWSAENDQDDLVWYKVPANGQMTAKFTGSYGTYLIHTYGVIKGNMVCLSATSIDVPKPEVSVQIQKLTDFSAQVTVTGVPIYIHDVQLPTWTNNNGQDDIRWYHATKQADGSYIYTFYAKNHNFESGHYNVHVYGISEVTHSLVGLSGSDGIDLVFDEELTHPTVVVDNYDANKGVLQVVVSETQTTKDIQNVTVAAWSDPNQKNLHWYSSAKVVNGQVIITVDEKYHHNIAGNYTVHVYVTTADDEVIGINLGQFAFNNTEATTSVSASYKGTGVYGVTVSGVYSNGTVKYAVWSDVNGQDDIRWYDATTCGATATGLINVANHSGKGIYHVHVYQSDNGQMFFLGETEFKVKRTDFSAPYYNQRDGRWAETRFGYYRFAATGCVPTSLSMVFSALTGTEVLPTTVGSYLYNNTIEYNRGGEGTSGMGIIYASRQWGLKTTVLKSQSALAATLKEGHYVVAAVQMDKFSPWGWGTSHEIVLKGFSNGNTYVYDPYEASNNGWYPVELLWKEQSTQEGDVNGLGRPFVKITDA
ncbi:GBS Bsp-like repeat-containing protein [Streptococcus equinus]|uniref:GBS Bsp-like repeat-containing protein n=1 Tax=Streptococcus equinus TaxID=1335 RepID=UPI003BF81FBB